VLIGWWCDRDGIESDSDVCARVGAPDTGGVAESGRSERRARAAGARRRRRSGTVTRPRCVILTAARSAAARTRHIPISIVDVPYVRGVDHVVPYSNGRDDSSTKTGKTTCSTHLVPTLGDETLDETLPSSLHCTLEIRLCPLYTVQHRTPRHTLTYADIRYLVCTASRLASACGRSTSIALALSDGDASRFASLSTTESVQAAPGTRVTRPAKY
jgi:hypothetical protein